MFKNIDAVNVTVAPLRISRNLLDRSDMKIDEEDDIFIQGSDLVCYYLKKGEKHRVWDCNDIFVFKILNWSDSKVKKIPTKEDFIPFLGIYSICNISQWLS
jgi:hypothetical protein